MIKFLDLHKINERHRTEIDAAIKEVLDSGWYLLGKKNEEFCKNFAVFPAKRPCLRRNDKNNSAKIHETHNFEKGN